MKYMVFLPILVAFSQSCPDLVPGAAMLLSNTSASPGDQPVTVTCEVGYHLNTNDVIKYLVCLNDSTWNDTLGICIPDSCTELVPGVAMLLSNTSANAGDQPVMATCQNGYHLNTGDVIMYLACLNDSTWNDTLGTCIPNPCPDLVSDVAMLLSNTSANPGDQPVTVTCDTGYHLSTYDVIMYLACLNDSTWNNTLGTCILDPCPDLVPGNATLLSNISGNPGDPPVTVTCHTGYHLSTDDDIMYLTCLNDSTWNDTLATCMLDPCPDLVPGNATLLSNISGNPGDPPVTVTCHTGYHLSTDDDIMYLTCLNDSTWNDTLATCILDPCPDLVPGNATLLSNISANPGDQPVTVTCDTGYHLSTDDDIMYLTCRNDSTWNDMLATCIQIVCATPPEVGNSSVHVSGLTYGSTAEYRCYSGFHSNGVYSVSVMCGSSSLWESTVVGWENIKAGIDLPRCERVSNSIGCFGCWGVPLSFMGTVPGVDECIEFCANAKLTALYHASCYCVNTDPTCEPEADSLCDMPCDGHIPSSPVSHNQTFCGGTVHVSMYYTYEGCYQGVSTTGVPQETVYGHLRPTCRERCRALDTTHAGHSQGDGTCFCFNTTQLAGSVPILTGTCKASAGKIKIYDLESRQLQGASCWDLLYKGIRMPGVYYLSNPKRKVDCSSIDGTVCEDGWTGYNGFCYITNAVTLLNFSDAVQFCDENDAELVSILSQDEEDFVNDYRRVFAGVWGNHSDPYWWLGMGDNSKSSHHMWLDGSLMRYANFKSGYPSNPDDHCVMEYSYGWKDANCSMKHNVMCKKRRDWSYCVSDDGSDVFDYSVAPGGGLSLTYCFEMCKGQGHSIAAVNTSACLCTSSPHAVTLHGKTECSTACPGQNLQRCGCAANDAVWSYINASGMPNAHSCADLEVLGIGGGTFLLQPYGDNVTTLGECAAPACPYSWLSVGDHCYKAILGTESTLTAMVTCARYNAYAVSIETTEEIVELIAKLNTIAIFMGQANWRIGLRALSRHHGLYRWANGQQLNASLWDNDNFDPAHEYDVAVSSDNATWSTTDDGYHVHICETGKDYVGCFTNIGGETSPSIASYDKMTIQLCVERCRADYQLYAYLTKVDCYCWSQLTEPASSDFICQSSCSGQQSQLCGGFNNHMTVYNVSEYPAFASSCEDIFDSSIFLSGDYVINGTLMHCDMLDGTMCDPQWFGYNGSCYRHFPVMDDLTRAETCDKNNAVQVSLTTTTEWQLMEYYIQRIDLDPGTRVFTGVCNGRYGLDVFISQDGHLVNPYLIDSDVIMTSDLIDDVGYISFRLNKVLEFPKDGGIICKKDPYVIGCFETPSFIIPTLENFGSIELTQCRQLCYAASMGVTLIGKGYCACAVNSDISSFAPPSGSCNVSCSIHQDQKCGDGSVVWAYATGLDYGEIRYAENCSSLYRAGIFYNTTYLLDSPSRYKQCGFSDNTPCPPRMLGKDGECYRFVREAVEFTSAAAECFKLDAYLFNPVNDVVHDFVFDFVTSSGLLEGLTQWHAGVWPLIYNYSYLSSNGAFVLQDRANETNLPDRHTAYDVETGVWFDGQAVGDLPYICQTNKDFLGCHSITTSANASYDSQWNSMTMCVQWCLGQDMVYAATHVYRCTCYDSLPHMTSAAGSCNTSCEAVPSQPCGGDVTDDDLYSVMALSDAFATATNCLDLYSKGVVLPGSYWIQSGDDPTPVKVKCLIGDPYETIRAENVSQKTATSVLTGYPVSGSSFTFPSSDVWKPAVSDTSPNMTILFDDPYFITGMLTAGLQTSDEFSYMTKFRLNYDDGHEYIQNGSSEIQTPLDQEQSGRIPAINANQLSPICNSDSGFCLLFFSKPFLTYNLVISATTWQESISLQMLIYGESFYEFNYVDNYIGCFLDPNEDFVPYGVIDNISSCTDTCKMNSFPFASLDYYRTCRCGYNGIENGKIDNTNCPVTTGGHRIGQNGTRRAIYRTYEATCDESDIPILQNGSISNVHYHVQDGVYTFYTLVHFICDDGYEFQAVNASDWVYSYCQQNNTWSELKYTCGMIDCPEFTVDNGVVTAASRLYQSEATVTCHPGYYVATARTTTTVTCGGNKQWSSAPTCTKENHIGSVQNNFIVTANQLRNPSGGISEFKCRHRLDCAAKCNTHEFCMEANYQSTASTRRQGTCRLFSTRAGVGDTATVDEWVYMARYNIP